MKTTLPTKYPHLLIFLVAIQLLIFLVAFRSTCHYTVSAQSSLR